MHTSGNVENHVSFGGVLDTESGKVRYYTTPHYEAVQKLAAYRLLQSAAQPSPISRVSGVVELQKGRST